MSNEDYRYSEIIVYWKSTVRPSQRSLLLEYVRNSHLSADYHQQYLPKNPNGYCGIGGCGVPFKLAELPVGEKA